MRNSKNIILIIGTVWPEPKSSAAGSRMMQLISFFQKADFEIVFATTAMKGEFSADLPQMRCEQIEMNSDSFDEFIASLNPNFVLFDRFMVEEQFGWRVSQICPSAVKLLDTEDLHCLRKSRELALKNNIQHTLDLVSNEEVAIREIASILRCDISLIISEFEMDLLKKTFNVDESLLYYLPLFAKKSVTILPYSERNGFVFIGNFLHKPNEDAVRFLKETIWPLIRKELKATLNIYGAYPSQQILQYHNPSEGFIIHGRAENALEVIGAARVMLAPIRFGAGLKGKLLEAMAMGTPSVTSSIGAEGISSGIWNGFIEDEKVKFANAAVELYHDKEVWDEAQELGFEILDERFCADDFYSEFIEMIFIVRNELDFRRHKNFTGRMLQHHTMRSTEYMSRWIQAKNQK